MVLCCTSGTPQAEVKTNGWDIIVSQENIIVISPTYNNCVTYGEISYIIKSVIDDDIQRYPIDVEEIYFTGFSNGEALSIVMISKYPKLLAGISAFRWKINMINNMSSNYKIPFMFIKREKKFTKRN